MKNRFCFTVLLLVATACTGAKYHTDSRGSEIHTPFRWTFADSAARVNQSVVAADTGKLAIQISDTTVWLLQKNSPKMWVQATTTIGRLTDYSSSTIGGFASTVIKEIYVYKVGKLLFCSVYIDGTSNSAQTWIKFPWAISRRNYGLMRGYSNFAWDVVPVTAYDDDTLWLDYGAGSGSWSAVDDKTIFGSLILLLK